MRYFFVLVMILSAQSARAHHQDAYMRLHQGELFFESYLKGECPLGKQEALVLLNRPQRDKVDADFGGKIAELKKMIESPLAPSLVVIEKFCQEVHDLMKNKKYKHAERWHEEVTRKCSIGA